MMNMPARGRRSALAAVFAGFVTLHGCAAWAQNGQPQPKPNAVVDAGVNTDPTKNVDALVKALEEKTRELRDTDLKQAKERLSSLEQLVQTKIDLTKEISDLKSKHSVDMIKSQGEEIKLRAEMGDKLSTKETDRINAIRLVDVQAVQVATERATSAATALAAQVVQSAEVLRTQQARQAEDFRSSLASAVAELSKRTTTVEQGQSEGRGKQQFQDPALTALLAKVDALTQQRATATGTDTGQSNVVGYLFAGIGLLLAAVAAVAAVVTGRRPQPPYPYPPQNGYPPPPANGPA